MTGPSAWSRCTGSSASSAPVARCAYPRSRSSPMNWSTRLRRWVRIRTPPVRGGVDEAHGGDGLAGAGRVLEPEALGRVGVLGGLLELVLVERDLGGVGRLLGLRLVLVVVVLVVVELRLDGLEVVFDGQHRLRGGLRARLATSDSASSAANVPDSASTWCGFSSVPSARRGSSCDRRRSSPSRSDQARAHSVDGCERPSSSSRRAASSARRRWEPDARTSAASSPGGTNRSRANSSARSIWSAVGTDVAAKATGVRSAKVAYGTAMAAPKRERGKPGEQTPVWHCVSTAEDLRKT